MLSEDIDLASILLRAAAFVLDAAILIVLVLTIGSFALAAGVALGTVVPVMIVVAAAYNIGFVTATGATPGKTALGLQIVDRQLARPRPDTAILRFLVYFAFGVAFPFGAIANVASLLADAERRTFPGRIAGTLVLQARRE